MPAALIGKNLVTNFGLKTAISSILIGNLILWLISISIITMSLQERKNSIQNIGSYLGGLAAKFAGIVLTIAFVNWFILQISITMTTLKPYITLGPDFSLLRLGAGIGFLISLLSMGGIQLIKWLTTLTFPLIIGYYLLMSLGNNTNIPTHINLPITFLSIAPIIFILLPGIINLPTFFRHSKSKADCYLALTLLVLISSFFEISGIWIELHNFQNYFLFAATVCFILWSLVCTNLLNIYYASACWECFFPRFEGAKGYAIIGLIGTAAYTYIQLYSPLLFIENLANGYIATLGVVLLITFLVKLIIRHRPRPLEKTVNSLCWFAGCIAVTFTNIENEAQGMHAIFLGSSISALTFVCVLFFEESIWALKKITRAK